MLKLALDRPAFSDELWGILDERLEEWPPYDTHACIQAATDDYRQLAERTRHLEETMARKEAENTRLRNEKQAVMQENTKVKQEAHREITQAVARLKGEVREAQQRAAAAAAEKDRLDGAYEQADAERVALRSTCTQREARIRELAGLRDGLKDEVRDLAEALQGEQDARQAATEELRARLTAKEHAESEKEAAEARFLAMEKQYLSTQARLAVAQDDANREFHRWKEAQEVLAAEKAQWEEQLRVNPLRASQGGPGLQRTAFQIGSMFGSLRNAVAQGAAQSQGGGQGGATPEGLGPRGSGPGQGAKEEGPRRRSEKQEATALPEMPYRQHDAAHGGGCNGVAFAPSGVHAATCGNDGAVRLWTAYDGALATELRASSGAAAPGINCVAIADERKLVLGASNDKSIKAWDMHTGRVRFTMTGHDKAVLAVAQHPTSPNVAVSCGEDRVLRLWSLADGICRRTIPCRSKPLSVAFSREGDFIASGHFDGTVRVYDAGSGKEVKTFERKHFKECVHVAPMQHASRFLSVGKDDAVCVTDIFKTEVSKRFAHPDVLHIGQNRCGAAVAPDDSMVAVGASSGLLVLLNTATGAVDRKLSCHSNAITGAAWSAQSEDSGVVVASCDRGGGLVFWKSAQALEGA